MPILEKIRRKKSILIVVLSVSIAGILFNFDQFSHFLDPNPNIYGTVNGENISKQDFDILNSWINSQHQDQVSEEQSWKYLIQNKLIAKQFDKSGLKLDEVGFWKFIQHSSILKKNPSFLDKTGNFRYNELKKQIQKLKEKSQTDENSEILYNNWIQHRFIAEYDIKKKLYFSTLLKGLLINNKEVKFIQQGKLKNAQIEFILIDYDQYNVKNKIIVTNEELKEYIDAHKQQFKKDPSVGLKYVLFENNPTVEDNLAVYTDIQTYAKGGIILNEQQKIIDSVKGLINIGINSAPSYINDYSDQKLNSEYYYLEQQPQPIQNWLKNAKIGDTFGPYLIENSYIVSKLLGKKSIDSISSRHILISYKRLSENLKRTKEQAKKLADSILRQVSNDSSNFSKLVSLSDDFGSIQRDGNLGWTITGNQNFIPEIQRFLEYSAKGTVGLIETQFGYHIVNVLNKKKSDKSYYVGHLVKNIKPSQKTTESVDTKAISFAQEIENKSEKDFEILAKKKNYEVIDAREITRFVSNLNGNNLIDYRTNEEILRWAFNSKRKVRDSNIFTTPNQDHIVVIVTSINPKGLVTPQIVRPEIETIVRNKKIEKLLIKQINNSKRSLNHLAKTFNVAKRLSVINFQNPIIEGIGIEPQVVGVAFGIKPNTLSKAIAGKKGIFVITTKNLIKDKRKNIVLSQLKKEITQQVQQLGLYRILSGLENQAEIKDLRLELRNK